MCRVSDMSMRRQFKQFVALSRLTTVEVVRQPICLLLTLTAVIGTGLVPLTVLHVFGEEGKLVRNSGLSLHFVIGLFVAGYASCTAVAQELRSGTASAVLSKPVRRSLFFLAKYAGVVVVVLLFSTACSIATLVSERAAERFILTETHIGYSTDWQTGFLLLTVPVLALSLAAVVNFTTKRPFGSWAFGLMLAGLLVLPGVVGCFSRAGHWEPFNTQLAWRLLPVHGLIAMALSVVAAIALALSVRMKAVPTMTGCTAVFLLGLMSDYLFGRSAGTDPTMAFIYRVLPNWQHFWASDALNDGGCVAASYLCRVSVYAALYTVGFLCVGLAGFQNVEME
jgi:ABC-type transport system involved in multi-copper enzyme maturation permease subunit